MTRAGGGTYTLADENNALRVDFMNRWMGTGQECWNKSLMSVPLRVGRWEMEPRVTVTTFHAITTSFLLKTSPSGSVCDSDVRRFIVDEATDVVNILPLGPCVDDSELIPKSWTTDPLLDTATSSGECDDSPLKMLVNKKERY